MSSKASSARWTGSRSAQSAGGNGRRPGGGAADQAQRLGEGDPVRVEIGGRGGLRGQRTDRVVDDQVGPDLLMPQVGQPRAQHPAWAPQMGLELVVAGLVLPPLVVGGGQLVGTSPVLAGGVGDGGQQHDQLAGAVAVLVADVVLDDPGQVDDGQSALVERVGNRVDVSQVQPVAGGG